MKIVCFHVSPEKQFLFFFLATTCVSVFVMYTCCDDHWKFRLLEEGNLFFGSLFMALDIYKTCGLLQWGKHEEFYD